MSVSLRTRRIRLAQKGDLLRITGQKLWERMLFTREPSDGPLRKVRLNAKLENEGVYYLVRKTGLSVGGVLIPWSDVNQKTTYKLVDPNSPLTSS